ncbi:MAG: LptE family protein [Planctomycetes bacterium]|nr:LptE family protein [Planctomycetota bacterium]
MRLLWLGLFTACLLLAACGYTSRSQLRQNVNTIYIPIFDNLTYRRGLEFDLTNALKNEILFRTRLKIVDKDHADSILYGSITDVKKLILLEAPGGNPAEAAMVIIIDFSWVDLRTGRTIVDKKNITQQAEFIVRMKEDEGTAEREAFVDLSEKVINLMEENW